MTVPQFVNLLQFENILNNYLFLKSDEQLRQLDLKFVHGKSRELSPSQMQRCLIETAFALLNPSNESLVLAKNIMTFVMVILGVGDPESNEHHN